MIRAFVSDHFASFRVAVTLVRTPEGEGVFEGNGWILRFVGDPVRADWERIEDPAGADVKPTVILGHEEARALLDGLMEHYQGASDTRALRQDRDHERGRVDKLIDVVAEIAKERA